MIHNTLKFIESFKVISLFSYQCSLCRSRRQLVYYILSSLFCQELFSFFQRFFSIGFVRSVHCLKRDNSDILSCVVLFVKNFFILFWKIFQNLVARCKNMSYFAVSLTIIAPVSSSVNSFFIINQIFLRQLQLLVAFILKNAILYLYIIFKNHTSPCFT